MLAAAQAAAGTCAQRPEALVEDSARTERIIDASAPLLTVRLTDLGPVGANTPAIDPEAAGRDVVCDLRPSEACKLAASLLDLAGRVDFPEAA